LDGSTFYDDGDEMMTMYSIALFLHIVGALGFFAVLGLEWMSLRQLRRATTAEQVREWLSISTSVGRVAMLSMMTLFGSGIYMVVTVWGGIAWVLVSLGSLVVLGIIATRLIGGRMAAIRHDITNETGSLSPALSHVLHHPALWIAIHIRVAVALGIVFLMTVKPGLIGSLLTIGIAALLGLVSALPSMNRKQTQTASAA
jgi:hypothetical protein